MYACKFWQITGDSEVSRGRIYTYKILVIQMRKTEDLNDFV